MSITAGEPTAKECAAALIDLCITLKELLRRLPGNADLEARVGYALTRLQHHNQGHVP